MIYIIIPAYNVSAFIRQTLESCLAQTYQAFTLLIMNDGSTDDTGTILKEYAQKDPRIRVFDHPNQGVTKTLNDLLDQVPREADYIFYLDADDILHPEILTRLHALIQETQADVAECSFQRIKTTETIENLLAANEENTSPAGQAYLLQDMDIFFTKKTARGPWFNRWNKLYRWSSVSMLRFNEGLAYEDDYFYACEVSAQIHKKVITPEVLYYYRTNPSSMTGRLNFEKYLTSAINRIRLSVETFLKPGRVPAAYLEGFKTDLALDAYRMILRKNLKKNKNLKQCRQLFNKAADALKDLNQNQDVEFKRLAFFKRVVIALTLKKQFLLAKLLVYLT